MPKCLALYALALGFIATDVSAAIVRDTASDELWKTQPSWKVEAFGSPNFDAYPAITFIGNGQRVESLTVIASFLDPFDEPNPPLTGDSIDIQIGYFSGLTDWFSEPTRLTATIDLPANALWRDPVDSIAGVNFYSLTFDLAELNLETTAGQTQLLSVSIIGAQQDPNLSGILGFLQCTPTVASPDYFAGRKLYEHTGDLVSWTDDVFSPAPSKVAAIVTTIPEPTTSGVLGIGGALLLRRRR